MYSWHEPGKAWARQEARQYSEDAGTRNSRHKKLRLDLVRDVKKLRLASRKVRLRNWVSSINTLVNWPSA